MFICEECVEELSSINADLWFRVAITSRGQCEICKEKKVCSHVPRCRLNKLNQMPKTYILQKDLPDYKANERFTLEDDGSYYKAETSCADGIYGRWPPSYVENNPEWFIEEQKNIGIRLELNNETITITDKGIEYVLPVKRLLELIKQDDVSGWNDKKYTEQDMRECFRNSRRKSTLQSPWQTGEFSWLSFDHYMSFVKQPKYKIPPLE